MLPAFVYDYINAAPNNSGVAACIKTIANMLAKIHNTVLLSYHNALYSDYVIKEHGYRNRKKVFSVGRQLA